MCTPQRATCTDLQSVANAAGYILWPNVAGVVAVLQQQTVPWRDADVAQLCHHAPARQACASQEPVCLESRYMKQAAPRGEDAVRRESRYKKVQNKREYV